MNKKELVELLPELQVFLKTLSIFSIAFISSVIGSYFIAWWLWSENLITASFILASTTFIAFYLIQARLITLTCLYLKQDSRYSKMVHFIQQNLKTKPEKEFIKQLEKAITVVSSSN